MADRPLWRTGTKKALQRLAEIERVQRAQLADMPLSLLLAEVRARGWHVIPPTLPANWPPLADEDELLPFEDERG